jgi:hypothetical protein
MIEIPINNLETYKILFQIENCLRELIIEQCEILDGAFWYKKRIPGGKDSPLEKYINSVKIERSYKFTDFIPLHPIYYIDFTDIKRLIEKSDNWNEVFSKIFDKKENIIGNLTLLEPVRNKIAHNRLVTEKDLLFSKSVNELLKNTLGLTHYNGLLIKTTKANNINNILRLLLNEIDINYKLCLECKVISNFNIWNDVKNRWWFDETYLGFNVNSIFNLFKVFIEYTTLDRNWGCGHKIEEWVNNKNLVELYNESKNIILNIK